MTGLSWAYWSVALAYFLVNVVRGAAGGPDGERPAASELLFGAWALGIAWPFMMVMEVVHALRKDAAT